MKLYRFEPLSIERLQTVNSGEIWVSPPGEFNDIKDCILGEMYPPRSLNQEQLEDLIENIKKTYASLSSIEQFRRVQMFLIEFIENVTKHYYKNTLSKVDYNLRMKSCFDSISYLLTTLVRVCCFNAGTPHDPLGWGYYARGHKGFCVEYEFNSNWDSNIYPVTYTSEEHLRFSARELGLCPDETLNRLFLTKTSHWSHENEYRFIEFNLSGSKIKGGRIKLPDSLTPTRLILGKNVQLDDAFKAELEKTTIKVINYSVI